MLDKMSKWNHAIGCLYRPPCCASQDCPKRDGVRCTCGLDEAREYLRADPECPFDCDNCRG